MDIWIVTFKCKAGNILIQLHTSEVTLFLMVLKGFSGNMKDKGFVMDLFPKFFQYNVSDVIGGL